MTNLTTKELEVLETVKKYQNDNGHSRLYKHRC